jgi:hypothetical protein
MMSLISNLDRSVAIALGFMALAGAVWLIAIVVSIVSRAPQPKRGLRRSELAVIWLSLVFVASAAVARSATSPGAKKEQAEPAATTAHVSRGTCASLKVGMKARDVRASMGEPDEVRSEEDVRGPEAEAWVYRASRCSVHVLSGKVDFID